MSAARTCLRCGHEGGDVRMALVEYDDPAPVTVAMPGLDGPHGPRSMDYIDVPGRYGAEWRCVDHAACTERALALAPVARVEATEGPVGEADGDRDAADDPDLHERAAEALL